MVSSFFLFFFCQLWVCLVSAVDLQQLLAAGSRIIQQTCGVQGCALGAGNGQEAVN